MTNERVQRRVERLLDQIDAAEAAADWHLVENLAKDILDLDEKNQEALAYQRAAERRLGIQTMDPGPVPSPYEQAAPQPTSFANGRYKVVKFLGEGGKEKVYLAHDATLDRDVAFAEIKTDDLDEAARIRVTREAQAMAGWAIIPISLPFTTWVRRAASLT